MSAPGSSESTEYPFSHLKIASFDLLHRVSKRSKCTKCHRSRMHYCYSCYLPVEGLRDKLPAVKLPLKIDIIKHPREVEGKSTAVHAAILAPDDVTIYTYPCIPEIQDKNKVLLVFPENDSITMEQLAAKITRTREDVAETVATTSAHKLVERLNSDMAVNEVLPVYSEQPDCCAVTADSQVPEGANAFKDDGITADESSLSNKLCNAECRIVKGNDSCVKNGVSESAASDDLSVPNKKLKLEKCDTFDCVDCKFERVLFIDSTWNQVKSICTDERLKDLTKIKLCKHRTLFWRYQRQSDSYLATIEAIYYFLVEYHETVLSLKYEGQYDNLLYFFAFMFDKIRNEYEVNTVLKSYSEKRNCTIESNDDTCVSGQK